MLKKYSTGFSMAYYERILVCVSGSSLQLLLTKQSQKITQCHQIMWVEKYLSRLEHTKSLLIIGKNDDFDL